MNSLCDKIEKLDSGIESGQHYSSAGVVTESEIVSQTEMMRGVAGVECSICPRSDSVMFQLKSEMLSHLSWIHLSNELLTLFPPSEDGKCGFCDEGFQSQEEYIKHTGMSHEKVLEILPSDFCDKILSMEENMKNDDQVETELAQRDQEVSVESSVVSPSPDQSHQATPEPRKLDFKFILSSEKDTGDVKEESCKENMTAKVEQLGAAQSKSFCCRYCGEMFNQSKSYRLHLLAHRDKLINKSKLA